MPMVLKEILHSPDAENCPVCIAEAKTQQRLVALGYEIEDMDKTYGPVYTGQFRWLLLNLDLSVPDPLVDFQDHEPSYKESDAWDSALEHAKEMGTWAV